MEDPVLEAKAQIQGKLRELACAPGVGGIDPRILDHLRLDLESYVDALVSRLAAAEQRTPSFDSRDRRTWPANAAMDPQHPENRPGAHSVLSDSRHGLRILDTGHWAVLYLGEERLFAVYLDGDSIEGRRSPEAEARVSWLARLASAWENVGDTAGMPMAVTVSVARAWRCASGAESAHSVVPAPAPALHAYNCSYAEPGPWAGWTVSAARIKAFTPEAAKVAYLCRLRERFPAAKEEAVHVRLDCQQPEAGVQP